MDSSTNAARIAVIEDNASDVRLLRHALDELGEPYEFEVLRDGEEAMQFVEQHRLGIRKPDPCVIVLDLHLPRYDGTAVLQALRAAPSLGHIRVIVLTTQASPAEEAAV